LRRSPEFITTNTQRHKEAQRKIYDFISPR
jgi:hypothetical protein